MSIMKSALIYQMVGFGLGVEVVLQEWKTGSQMENSSNPTSCCDFGVSYCLYQNGGGRYEPEDIIGDYGAQ